MVEIFFGIIIRQAIRRDTFTSVPDLIGAIRAFIDPRGDVLIGLGAGPTPTRWLVRMERHDRPSLYRKRNGRTARPGMETRTADARSGRRP
jgi:hypothetical protein